MPNLLNTYSFKDATIKRNKREYFQENNSPTKQTVLNMKYTPDKSALVKIKTSDASRNRQNRM